MPNSDIWSVSYWSTDVGPTSGWPNFCAIFSTRTLPSLYATFGLHSSVDSPHRYVSTHFGNITKFWAGFPEAYTFLCVLGNVLWGAYLTLKHNRRCMTNWTSCPTTSSTRLYLFLRWVSSNKMFATSSLSVILASTHLEWGITCSTHDALL